MPYKRAYKGSVPSGYGGGGSSLPIPASGLQSFWDYSDLTTMFTDAAGTTPVTTDGDLVELVQDKSGNGNHGTASGTARPTYRTDGTYHWLEFNGTANKLDVPNTYQGDDDSDNTGVAAVRVGASGFRYILGNLGDKGFEMLFANARIRPFVGLTTGNALGLGAPSYLTNDIVASFDWTRSTFTARGWTDQSLEVTATGGDFDKSTPTASSIGASSTASFWSGRMYGLAVYSTKLSDSDRGLVETYMAGLGGITL